MPRTTPGDTQPIENPSVPGKVTSIVASGSSSHLCTHCESIHLDDVLSLDRVWAMDRRSNILFCFDDKQHINSCQFCQFLAATFGLATFGRLKRGTSNPGEVAGCACLVPFYGSRFCPPRISPGGPLRADNVRCQMFAMIDHDGHLQAGRTNAADCHFEDEPSERLGIIDIQRRNVEFNCQPTMSKILSREEQT